MCSLERVEAIKKSREKKSENAFLFIGVVLKVFKEAQEKG